MSDFTWVVAENGYAWAEDYRSDRRGRDGRPVSGGRFLVPRDLLDDVEGADGAGFVADDREVAFRRYHPLDESSGLFREFARLPPTEPKIREFADRYGTLGANAGDTRPLESGADDSESEREGHEQIHRGLDVAQSFDRWSAAVAAMKRAVELLDNLPADRKGPVARELQELVQGRLTVTGVIPRFRLDPLPFRQPPLHLAPVNLLGAMWLQLARAVSGNKAFRECGRCGKPFELSPDRTRKSRKYCSERCRSRAYRVRIDAAQEMRRAGKTLGQIAAELGSDIPTVKGWVGE